jgi:hypothetical protein
LDEEEINVGNNLGDDRRKLNVITDDISDQDVRFKLMESADVEDEVTTSIKPKDIKPTPTESTTKKKMLLDGNKVQMEYSKFISYIKKDYNEMFGY